MRAGATLPPPAAKAVLRQGSLAFQSSPRLTLAVLLTSKLSSRRPPSSPGLAGLQQDRRRSLQAPPPLAPALLQVG